MPRRIEEDWKMFRDIVSGRLRRALKKFIKSGQITRARGKNGKISISFPKIDIPHIVYGDSDEGVGRGQGQEGDVIGRDPGSKGSGAGQDHADGITVDIELEEVLRFMQDELELPNLKPKSSQTFEDVKIKYNNISLVGPESLRHNRRTFMQAIKRQAAMGTLDKLHYLPGCTDPIPLIEPIAEDKRYRQFKEIRIPSSNALIVFARDGSGSMDAQKCEIVSDMSWWIDVWIRRFYQRTERLFVWHDTAAEEVDEEKFYRYRMGGGTLCSSAPKYIAQQFEHRFPKEKYNIYVFYFTDGDNWNGDNEVLVQTLKNDFGPEAVNFCGVTQILPYAYDRSVKQAVDKAIVDGTLDKERFRTVGIGSTATSTGMWGSPALTDEERDKQVLRAIRVLLGGENESE